MTAQPRNRWTSRSASVCRRSRPVGEVVNMGLGKPHIYFTVTSPSRDYNPPLATTGGVLSVRNLRYPQSILGNAGQILSIRVRTPSPAVTGSVLATVLISATASFKRWQARWEPLHPNARVRSRDLNSHVCLAAIDRRHSGTLRLPATESTGDREQTRSMPRRKRSPLAGCAVRSSSSW
jgi:hypothetical protein